MGFQPFVKVYVLLKLFGGGGLRWKAAGLELPGAILRDCLKK